MNLIPVPETEDFKDQLKDIPKGERARFIRACVAYVNGDEQERKIARAEIDLIKMKSKGEPC